MKIDLDPQVAARRLRSLAYLSITGFCCYLAWSGLKTRFAVDDMMNLYYYWSQGFPNVLWQNVTFWSTEYRPAGGFYYLPLYHIFGLDPLPFRVAILAFVAANSYLNCVVAERLTESTAAAIVTGVLAGAHLAVVDIYFVNSDVYDILSYFFMQVALIGYISIRKRGLTPGWSQSLWLTAALITALNAKEISAGIAGFVLAYEVLFHGFPKLGDLPRWVRREGRVPMLFLVLTGIYLAGKLLRPNPSLDSEGYRMEITASRYVYNNGQYLQRMLYAKWREDEWLFAIFAVLLGLLIFARRSPAVRWAAFYALTATIPLSFIPARGGGSLYVPMFGWALMAGITAATVIRWLSAAALHGRVRRFRAAVEGALAAVLAMWIALQESAGWERRPVAYFASQEQLTLQMIQQLQASPYRPVSGHSILVLDDPFEGFNTQFIAELTWNDPSVKVKLGRKYPEPPSEAVQAEFDDVLTFQDGNFKVLRSSTNARNRP